MNETTTVFIAAGTDPASLFRARAARFGAIVAGAAGREDAPTPCDGWTVRDLVTHVIDSERQFLTAHGVAVPEPAPGDALADAWSAHAEAAFDGLAAGAADTAFDGHFGPTTVGATVTAFYGLDLVVHAWDLAVATGQQIAIGDAEAEELIANARGWGDALYADGVCRAAVPVADDAPAVDRLLGMLGRDPHRTP